MQDFKNRSTQPEILDGNGYSKSDLFKNLQEIDSVNRLLGGHNTTLTGINRILHNVPTPLIIADFGCGSGESLKYIARLLERKNIQALLYGIDNNSWTCEYARNNCKTYNNIKIIEANFNDISKIPGQIHIGISTLFCHHLHGEQLTGYIDLMKKICSHGIIINDLHRHALPYYFISIIANLANGTEMLKNDAPLSVRRGFRKNELKELMEKSDIKYYTIEWRWAFRYLVVAYLNAGRK